MFFVAGVGRAFIGDFSPWFVLMACALSIVVRAIDIESWAFFLPGGLVARTERAFGPRACSIAMAVTLTERLLLVALSSVLCVQYALSFAAGWMAQWTVTSRLTLQELVLTGAIVLIAVLWTRSRLHLQIPQRAVIRGIWVGILFLHFGYLVKFERHLEATFQYTRFSRTPPSSIWQAFFGSKMKSAPRLSHFNHAVLNGHFLLVGVALVILGWPGI